MTIEPVTDGIALRLAFSVHGLPTGEAIRAGFWALELEDEANELAEHLAKVLGLDEVPAVKS